MIHLAGFVGEDPQRRDLLGKIRHIRLRVALGHAEQDQQAVADLSYRLAVHFNRRAGDALDDSFQSLIPSSLSRRFLFGRPPEKPPSEPSPATTRWQGTSSGTGLAPQAAPTARAAPGLKES